MEEQRQNGNREGEDGEHEKRRGYEAALAARLDPVRRVLPPHELGEAEQHRRYKDSCKENKHVTCPRCRNLDRPCAVRKQTR